MKSTDWFHLFRILILFLICFSISLVQWHLSMYCIQLYGLYCLHTILKLSMYNVRHNWVKSFLKGVYSLFNFQLQHFLLYRNKLFTESENEFKISFLNFFTNFSNNQNNHNNNNKQSNSKSHENADT